MRPACCLVFALTFALRAHAQPTGQNPDPQPIITSGTSVSSAQLQQWLHSGNPRLIAWAADFARRNNETEVLNSLPALLESRPFTAPYPSADRDNPAAWATTAILDALIQRDIRLPTSTIRVIEQDFPSQAVILISRLSLPDAKGNLDSWSTGWGGARKYPILARIATMILANQPDPALVARVLADSEEELTIQVHLEGHGTGYGATTSCGDSVGRSLPAGWPPIYTYRLIERMSGVNPIPIVDLDGDRIVAYRADVFGGWGSCTGEEVEPLDAVTRHRLIAHWLGIADRSMPWQANESESITWHDQADYEKQLGSMVDAHLRKLRTTADALQHLGLLQEDPAAKATPRLNLKVLCEIDPCPLTP